MMFAEEYKRVYFLLFVIFTIRSGAKANQTLTTEQPTILSSTGQIQPSGVTGLETSVLVPSTSLQHKSAVTTGQHSTTKIPANEEKLEPYVIIIISTSAAVAFILIIILLLLCVFRRRRIQRLERERNLSYNNMNYESTVKFRADMNTDGTTLESRNPPRNTNNNPQRDAGYELVGLPSDKEPAKQQYENVSPRKANDTGRQPYENVTPMVSSANDKVKAPAAPYEEVFLDSTPEEKSNGKKSNDKYYENVKLNN